MILNIYLLNKGYRSKEDIKIYIKDIKDIKRYKDLLLYPKHLGRTSQLSKCHRKYFQFA